MEEYARQGLSGYTLTNKAISSSKGKRMEALGKEQEGLGKMQKG